jgi:restriction endonuclease S subunit
VNTDELPEGWTQSTLGELVIEGGIFDGPFGSSLKSSDYTDSGVRVIRLENLANLEFVGEKRTYISLEKYATLTKHSVREGDVLVGSFMDGAVRVAVLPPLDSLAIAKADCFCVRPEAMLLDKEYMAYQIGCTQSFESFIEDIHGATRPRITTAQLRKFNVLLPPLAEQRRIVAAVERILDKVNAARARLDRVPTTLKRFRQAVLAAACSGRLTADWREKNPSTPLAAPPFDPEAELHDLPALPECPEEWRISTVGGCSKLVQYGTSEKADPTGAVPLLRMGNLQDGKVVFYDLKFVTESLPGLATLLLHQGDLLFNRTNSPELVGKSAVFSGPFRATFASYLIRVRCKPDVLDSQLLCWWINSMWGREWAAKVRTDGVSQSNINGTKLQQMPLLLPPLAEQQEIVKRVSALFARADAIEAKVAAARKRVDTLTQAVLAKAFRGELVPTEAELARREKRPYESASELLARVRTPAITAIPKPKRTRKKPDA